jgi:hypothetical protein
MVEGVINLKKLNLDELNGVVTLYPWYGGARKELCRRMAALGEGAWSDERYADAALYVGSRSLIGELAHKGKKMDYSDRDVSELLKNYIDSGTGEVKDGQERRIRVVGGDYFSGSQYEKVARDSDKVFSSFATKAREEGYVEMPESEFTDFCTETLAQIYAEQGYDEQARSIYSRLSLRYPEKSAYFAALIEKLK